MESRVRGEGADAETRGRGEGVDAGTRRRGEGVDAGTRRRGEGVDAGTRRRGDAECFFFMRYSDPTRLARMVHFSGDEAILTSIESTSSYASSSRLAEGASR